MFEGRDIAGVWRCGEGVVGLRNGDPGIVRWTLGGEGVAAGVGNPMGMGGMVGVSG